MINFKRLCTSNFSEIYKLHFIINIIIISIWRYHYSFNDLIIIIDSFMVTVLVSCSKSCQTDVAACSHWALVFIVVKFNISLFIYFSPMVMAFNFFVRFIVNLKVYIGSGAFSHFTFLFFRSLFSRLCARSAFNSFFLWIFLSYKIRIFSLQ